MGFTFVRGRKKKSSGDLYSAGERGKSSIHNHDHVDLLPSTKCDTETRLMSRRNKILNKVMLKRSKSKRTTTTTETTTVASSTQTPATAVMGQDTPYTGTGLQRHQEHQWITDRAVEIAIEDPDFYMQPGMGLVGDGETQSVLDEREFIRQQLFYEEQGVEVAAQFSPSPNGTSRTTLYPASIQNPPRQQQKEILTTSVERSVAVSPDNHYSFEKPAQTPLPPTPQLEPSEVDPLKHFPAVAAAVAKAEASRRHRAPVVVRTVSENSNSVSETSAISGQQQQHQRPGMATQTPSASLLPKTVVTPPTPSPEKPFDEVDGPEDPTIAEMEQMERQRKAAHRRPFSLGATKESKESAVSSEKAQKEESVPPETRGQAEEEKEDKDITRKLLDAFNCGGDDFTEFSGSTAQNTSRSCRLVDAFYDNTCWTYREAAAVKRPYYDERFAQRFLKDITEEGVNVLWHLPPTSGESAADDSNNWSGCSVIMQIKPGSCYSTNNIIPKLEWKTLSGGKKTKTSVQSIPLLDIQSIATFNETICEGEADYDEEMFTNACGGMDDEDVCLFAITTDEGDVHVFEATSPRERDLLVAGLKNVIARLSFHLIVGDAGASSELYTEEIKDSPQGELPAYTDPTKNMNRIAHALLD